MPKIQDIPFSRIPHQSALFLNYLAHAPNALRFYQHAPTIENLVRKAQSTLSDLQFPRNEIASILLRQNEQFGSDAETASRINELKKDDCVAIVTGQQVGLFTGPLYTVYKALTAIRIAEELKNRGVRAVPVFWLETEDHDLSEATQRTLWGPASSVIVKDYRNMLFQSGETPRGSVGATKLPLSIREVIEDYVSHLPDLHWKQEIQHQLESTYREGATFAQSFAQLLAHIFRGTGLILFDPQDSDAKRLISSLFQKAILESDAFRTALLQRNHDLRVAGFHTQVNIPGNSTVLFFFMDGERVALEKRDYGFCLKNCKYIFSMDKLLDLAKHEPEKFSPNVLLRPIIQDHLFPTLAYVGGSSEIAYFAQVEILYELFDRPMPIIWPRNSFTLVEPEMGIEMDRLGIDLCDCFGGRQSLLEKALRVSGPSNAASILTELSKHLDEGLAQIQPEMQAVDLTLVPALETARRKMLHNLQHLKSQAIRLEAAQNSRISNALDWLMSRCLPNQNLQERELGIQHFWIRNGLGILNTIRSCLEIDCFSHRVLHLD